VSAGKFKLVICAALLLGFVEAGLCDGLRETVRRGNRFYAQGQYGEAIAEYDRALTARAGALEAKFNKADSFYRLDDFAAAIELYKEVAAASRDMALVAKSKYNLGNCYFRAGIRQKDSSLQKCMEQLESAVSSWRQVLDIEPENKKAARNIEVARIIIKDIMDQLNKQKQQQEKSDKQNDDQQQQQEESESEEPSESSPQQQKQTEEKADQTQDPNEQQQQQQEQQPRPEEQQDEAAPEISAQEILDNEQRQRKERDKFEKGYYIRVEKDW